MANDKPNERVPPNQLWNTYIRPIKLPNTICPACMFAYRRINKEKGLINRPRISIGIRMMYKTSFPYQGNVSPSGSKMCLQ